MIPRLRRLIKYLFLFSFSLLIIYIAFARHKLPILVTMPASPSAEEVASVLLARRGLRLQSLKTIQSLWAGYGQICRITATPNGSPDSSAESSRSVSAQSSGVSTPQETQSYILKLITPPPTKADDEGHTRKILSYQVEQYFYEHLAPQLPASVPVAKSIASINQQYPDGTSTTAMVMSDLRQQFPVAGEKRNVLSTTQVYAALEWLSGFHGFWAPRVSAMDRSSLVLPPLDEVRRDGQNASKKTVWLNGGYTYLATRRMEYSSLANDHDAEWNEPLTDWVDDESLSISEIAAMFLAPRVSGWSPIEGYQTLIHGDVKSENLFTSTSGEQVAFYDFQYVGLGLGVCDLAKLFTCSVPLSMLITDRSVPLELKMQPGEKQLLKLYWKRLRDIGKQEYKWEIFVRHWETALVDWLRFQASWGFWGNTEWLEARVRSILNDREWRDALISNVPKAGLS